MRQQFSLSVPYAFLSYHIRLLCKKVLIFELGQDFHLLPTMPRCLNVLVFHHFTKASLNDALSTDGGTNRDF